MIVWKVSTNPNAELVNSMLDEYYETLTNGEKPIIHSDRGAHYRWPESIGIDFKEECPRKVVHRIIQHVKDFLEE